MVEPFTGTADPQAMQTVLWRVGIKAAAGDRAGYPPVVKNAAASHIPMLTAWLVTAEILAHRVKIADRQSSALLFCHGA
jgi:hypothetical protein